MRFHTGISWLIATSISIFPLNFSKASALLTGKKKKESGLEKATINDV